MLEDRAPKGKEHQGMYFSMNASGVKEHYSLDEPI
jgi:hypothetical protein